MTIAMSSLSVGESYQYCHELMRSAAKNFYFGMRLLPEAKRQAMYALYTYMRAIDDLTDDPEPGTGAAVSVEQRRTNLGNWRSATHRAVAGEPQTQPLWPAFADTVRRFAIPLSVFDDAIDGQIQDLEQSRYATFSELYQYCYRVASTVGIAAVHIWGYRDPQAIKLAEERGVALQLTNILRDLREDAARGRRYLPDEDFARFNCADWNGCSTAVPAGLEEMLHFEAERARHYYDHSAPLEAMVEADARPTLRVMTAIYRGILDRIAANPRQVLVRRVSLPKYQKLALVLRYAWQARMAKLTGKY